MATSKELRIENLRALVKEFRTADAVAQLAATAPMYLSQILNGVPSSTGKPRGVGDALARKLEAGCAKPVGWMDQSHQVPDRRQAIRDEVEDTPQIIGKIKAIPIVGRVQAGPDGTIQIDDYAHSDGYMMWYASSPDAYALRIRGESMSPRYLPGEVVGVDPSIEVQSNDEAIVMLRDGRRMIKRLLWCRDGQACFESVNKDFPNIILDIEEIDKMHLVSGRIPKAAFRSE